MARRSGSQFDSSRTRTARSGLRLTLTPQLEHLRACVEAARATLEPEAIHQARVASRRLRVFLTLAQVPVLHDDLRWLSRGLSRLRDLDVVRAEGWRGPFAAWLDAEHVAARRDAAALLQQPRLEGLLRALAVVAPLRKRQARTGHEAFIEAVDEAWDALGDARPAEVLSALHRLRRRARSARYACEWLGLDAARYRQLQEAAGAACDVIALAALVRAFERDTRGASSDAARLLEAVRARLVPPLMAHRRHVTR